MIPFILCLMGVITVFTDAVGDEVFDLEKLSDEDKALIKETEKLAKDFSEKMKSQAQLMKDETQKKALLAYIDRAEEQVKNVKKGGSKVDYKKMKSAYSTAVTSWSDLSSGDPKRTFKGLMTVGNTLSDIVPDPMGSAIGSICTLFSALLGKTQPSMTDVIESKLDGKFAELYTYFDEKFKKLSSQLVGLQLQSLRAEYEGAKVTIETMSAIMQGLQLSGVSLLEGDITFLHSQVSSTSGLRVVGMFRAMITHMLSKKPVEPFNQEDILLDVQEIYRIIKLYARISTFRRILIADARNIYAESKITNASKFALDQALQVTVDYDKSLFNFMIQPKNKMEFLVISRYNHKDNSFLDDFLHKLGRHPLSTNKDLFGAEKDIKKSDTVCAKFHTQFERISIKDFSVRYSDKCKFHSESTGTESSKFKLQASEIKEGLPLISLVIPSCDSQKDVPVCSTTNAKNNKGGELTGMIDSEHSCRFMFIKHFEAYGENADHPDSYSFVMLKDISGKETADREYLTQHHVATTFTSIIFMDKHLDLPRVYIEKVKC